MSIEVEVEVADAGAGADVDGLLARRPRERCSPGLDIELVDPRGDREWDAEVRTHTAHSAFHSSAWAKVLCRTYGHIPVYLRVREEGRTVAMVPVMEVRSAFTGRRGVCLPFSDFCAPLCFRGFDEGRLAQPLAKLAAERNWKYVEIRGGALAGSAADKPPGFYGHRLDLSVGLEALWLGLASPVRRAIRKAERGDLELRVSESESGMHEFFRLHVVTRRRHGLPPQPIAFFRHIQQEMMGSGAGFVAIAEHRGRPIAAAVFLRFGDSAVYKFGASHKRLWQLRPNNLVMWGGIQRLAQDGVKCLHFGRSSPDDEGLRRFKRCWGSQEELIQYSSCAASAGRWQAVPARQTGSVASALFSKMPSALNRLAGSLIYPHLD